VTSSSQCARHARIDVRSGHERGQPCPPANVTSDETWTSGIHVVPSTLQVKGGAHLAIEGCSEIQMGPDAEILVTGMGSQLGAVGDVGREIHFVRQQAPQAWGDIAIDSQAIANFAYVTLMGGGGTGPYATGTPRTWAPSRPATCRLGRTPATGSTRSCCSDAPPMRTRVPRRCEIL
jgi:hypothetical protein